ncbi:hypothetical protein DAI22_12g109625 [Oryza sativa Japonica Group]|nr:hypothetical protein DAI22_12g109625 [Oryza sativa Japonica Group]
MAIIGGPSLGAATSAAPGDDMDANAVVHAARFRKERTMASGATRAAERKKRRALHHMATAVGPTPNQVLMPIPAVTSPPSLLVKTSTNVAPSRTTAPNLAIILVPVTTSAPRKASASSPTKVPILPVVPILTIMDTPSLNTTSSLATGPSSAAALAARSTLSSGGKPIVVRATTFKKDRSRAGAATRAAECKKKKAMCSTRFPSPAPSFAVRAEPSRVPRHRRRCRAARRRRRVPSRLAPRARRLAPRAPRAVRRPVTACRPRACAPPRGRPIAVAWPSHRRRPAPLPRRPSHRAEPCAAARVASPRLSRRSPLARRRRLEPHASRRRIAIRAGHPTPRPINPPRSPFRPTPSYPIPLFLPSSSPPRRHLRAAAPRCVPRRSAATSRRCRVAVSKPPPLPSFRSPSPPGKEES